jgi:hydrogenase maturation protease
MTAVEAAPRRVLVVGLGNTDRGDDGIGVLVANNLRGRLPSDVTILAPIRDPLSLIDDLEEFDALVCVDAAAPLGIPGRIFRINLATEDLPRDVALVSSHDFGLAPSIDLARVLQLALPDIVVYAIEGSCFEAGTGVTPQVGVAGAEAVDRIVAEVDALRQASCDQ